MRTTAAVLIDPARPLEVIDLTVPAPGPGQALVEVAFSGVCQSQLLEVRGRRGPDRFLPHTLGHEGCGRVLEVGEGVAKVSPGDRVVMTWIKGTGSEVPSAAYESELGRVNSGAISTFMRHAMVSENRLVPIPETMGEREAALLGCAIPTGAGLVLNTARVRPGSRVAVFGVGGVGLSAVMAAELAHATTIIAVDIWDHKLEQARALGATHLVNARSDVLSVIGEITGGGVDYAIETAGRRETMELAVSSVRSGGGLAVLAGNLPHGERISIDPFDLIRGRRVVGSWGGDTDPDLDIPMYVRLSLSGRLKLDRLITHEYALEDVNQALEDLEEGRVGRGLIDMRRRGAVVERKAEAKAATVQ